MKKVFLTSVASLALVFPAIADINKTATTATCDSDTIGATSGNAYMDTAWTANTINLDFYSDGEKISTGSCTYDGAIELPEDPEDKTGYTFGGWQLRRAPAQSGFDLSTWEYGTVPSWNAQYIQYISNNGNVTMGTTTGLNNGEWRIAFENGTVRGIAYCSAKSGDNHDEKWGGNSSDWTATESELTSASGEAQYCWCKATSVDTAGNGSYTPVASSSWIFEGDDDDTTDCARNCVAGCASSVYIDDAFRRAVFGISE